jgi:CIC family chloride channel protein
MPSRMAGSAPQSRRPLPGCCYGGGNTFAHLMGSRNKGGSGIPVAVSMEAALRSAHVGQAGTDKRRLLWITLLAVVGAVVIGVVAKGMVLLIDLITNLAFFGRFSLEYLPPGQNHLGWWAVAIPVLGGVVVGLMALYGSKAIRGHGIPEAMEMILTNQSKIRPAITYLKPLSSAISIGTGGPFGAEGPIISTGGALGSMVGQLLRISPNERKVLLAAGATAGMSAIFGSPIAAIFLAIELLLFEFAPRSLVPVAMGCITGAAMHHLLFGSQPMFAMPAIALPGNHALFLYSVMGLLIGLLSLAITKAVYWVEDGFEKLPVHWMWWPAIGGVAVGVIGLFAPRTLGVGYENISELLSGNAPMQLILSLALLKLLSWGIALGSGTSGGTLAPLMTIGGAVGCLLGMAAQTLFPGVGIALPLAVLVGMSAMFAGASRALLTSVAFALETTGRIEALLPLLGACAASYLVSYFLMSNTIMTEKIARRGIRTPDSYEPDILEQVSVEQVMDRRIPLVPGQARVKDLLADLKPGPEFLFVADQDDSFHGVVNVQELRLADPHATLAMLATVPRAVQSRDNLRNAATELALGPAHAPVVVTEDGTVVGLLTAAALLKAYGNRMDDHAEDAASILLHRRRLKVLVQGKQLYRMLRHR